MDSFDATLAGIVVAATLAGTPWLVLRAKRRTVRAAEDALATRRRRTATARATIASMERTGWTINDLPQVELTMRLSDGASGELKVKRLIDPLEASRYQPGSSFVVRFEPGDATNVEVDFDGSGAPPAQEPVSASGAPFEWPLWIYGQRGAETWLLAPRTPARAPVVVMETSDPHAGSRVPLDEAVVEMSASLVAETLWMTTDVPAAAVAFVAVEQRKLAKPAEGLEELAEYAPVLRGRSASVVVWGAARSELASGGIEWRARAPGDDAERSFAGPLGECTEMIVSWLVGRGLARRVEPPPWWTPPSPEVLPLRAAVMHNLRLQILADRRNGALATIEAALHVGFVDLALDLAEQHPSQVHTMLAATTTHYARRAGQLTDALRERAIRMVESSSDPTSPARRLSPHWLASVAGEERGRARREEQGGGATAAYAAWLGAIAAAEKD